MKALQWKTHFMAECEDCDWSNYNHNNGRMEAAKHAKKTGHRVTGEEGFTFKYERPDTTGDNNT